MIHVLHIVQIVEHGQEFIEQLPVIAAHRGIALRNKLDLIHFEIDTFKGTGKRLTGLRIFGVGGEYGEHAVFVFDIGHIHIRFHQCFQHRLFVIVTEDKNSRVIEHVGHGALGADLALGLGERHAHITKGAVGVVGETLDNRHAAARAIALVTRRGKIFAATALCLVDGFLDHMTGHLILLGPVDQTA